MTFECLLLQLRRSSPRADLREEMQGGPPSWGSGGAGFRHPKDSKPKGRQGPVPLRQGGSQAPAGRPTPRAATRPRSRPPWDQAAAAQGLLTQGVLPAASGPGRGELGVARAACRVLGRATSSTNRDNVRGAGTVRWVGGVGLTFLSTAGECRPASWRWVPPSSQPSRTRHGGGL